MADTYEEDREALHTLIFDEDLERLNALIAEFNIFEAIGAVRQELRHSDFLSFLLNPNQNHGLSDIILKRSLMNVLANTSGTAVSAIDVDLMQLDQAEVRREWRNIDILIHDPSNNLVALIENKIGSTEHSEQLARYRDVVQHEFPNANIIPIFLTPEGDVPSDDSYLIMSYDTIAEVIEAVCRSYESTIGQDVLTLMRHYTTMLRRHIVSDSEIAELCRKVYRRHQRALDLIFDHRPDLLSDISDHLIRMIDQTPGLVRDHCSKSYVRFALSEWDEIQALTLGEGWTRSGRLLLFEFGMAEGRTALRLVVGPGPSPIRETLYAMSGSDDPIFRNRASKLYDKWTTIYTRRILSKNDFEDATIDDLVPKLDRAWERFLEEDLPRIAEQVANTVYPDM